MSLENLPIYVPNYYKDFKCSASACKHNCCVGWEIDIDEETYQRYKSLYSIKEKELGKRLKNQIEAPKSLDGELVLPHFVLSSNERCPFLNDDNLCDIISVLGQDSLCQVCSDHPRFRNFFDDRVELGLGLSCEVAAELIINSKDSFSISCYNDNDCTNRESDDEDFFRIRQQIFDILEDKTKSLDDSINNLFVSFGTCTFSEFKKKIKTSTIIDIYSELEQLDSLWLTYLNKIKAADNIYINHGITDDRLRQLLIYFLYRHLSESIYDGLLLPRIEFSVISTYLIATASEVANITIYEAARMYSSEIEYSDENMDILLDRLCNT